MAEMDVTSSSDEEEGTPECMFASRFSRAYFPATGTAITTMMAICQKMDKNLIPKGDGANDKQKNKSRKEKFEKLLESDPKLKSELLRYRRRTIKRWNKDRRAEAAANEGKVDDRPLTYPTVGRGASVIAGVFVELPKLAAKALLRYPDADEMVLRAQKVLDSAATGDEEDEAIIKEALAHRDARVAAWRNSGNGVTLRDGSGGVARAGVSAEAQTVYRAVVADWSGATGETASAALAAALEPLDHTPPEGDEEWDAIAETVSTVGRTYTGMQCYNRACTKKMLRPKQPPVWSYQPDSSHWRPRKPLLDGLDPSLPRGEYARSDLEQLSPKELYYLVGNLYNDGIYKLWYDKDACIEVLIESNMPAVDPRKRGATAFERANSKAFRNAIKAEVLARNAVKKSWEATRQRLEGPENARPADGQDEVARTVDASRSRLFRKKALLKYREKFAPGAGEDPPTREMPVLVGHFTAAPYMPHDVYDAAQDCAICLRLYEDTGKRVFCEHAWDVINELVAIRENGACGDRRT